MTTREDVSSQTKHLCRGRRQCSDWQTNHRSTVVIIKWQKGILVEKRATKTLSVTITTTMKKTLGWVFVFHYFEKGVRGGWSWWDWLNSSQGIHSNEPGQHETLHFKPPEDWRCFCFVSFFALYNCHLFTKTSKSNTIQWELSERSFVVVFGISTNEKEWVRVCCV